jgi:hypothetical protein
MKKILFLTFLLLSIQHLVVAQAYKYTPPKNQKLPTPNPKIRRVCTCDSVNITASLWIESPVATATNYILELQYNPTFAGRPSLGCPINLDSLYFFTRPTTNRALDRYLRSSELPPIENRLSADGSSLLIRYRIPFSFLRERLGTTMGIDFGVQVNFKFGNNLCTQFVYAKLEDELK